MYYRVIHYIKCVHHWGRFDMICYAMLSHVMLCYEMLCYVVFLYIILCYFMVYHITLYHCIACYIACYVARCDDVVMCSSKCCHIICHEYIAIPHNIILSTLTWCMQLYYIALHDNALQHVILYFIVVCLCIFSYSIILCYILWPTPLYCNIIRCLQVIEAYNIAWRIISYHIITLYNNGVHVSLLHMLPKICLWFGMMC